MKVYYWQCKQPGCPAAERPKKVYEYQQRTTDVGLHRVATGHNVLMWEDAE